MLLTRKNVRPLLRTVLNQPHATEDDHIDSFRPASHTVPNGKMTLKQKQTMTKEDIEADPMSSADGDQENASKSDSSGVDTTEVKASSRSQKRSSTRNARKTENRKIRPPKSGTYEAQQTDKKRRNVDAHEDVSPLKKPAATRAWSPFAEDNEEEDDFLKKMKRVTPKNIFTDASKSTYGGGKDPRRSVDIRKTVFYSSAKAKRNEKDSNDAKGTRKGFSRLGTNEADQNGSTNGTSKKNGFKKIPSASKKLDIDSTPPQQRPRPRRLGPSEQDDNPTSSAESRTSGFRKLTVDTTASNKFKSLKTDDLDPNASGCSTPLSSALGSPVLDLVTEQNDPGMDSYVPLAICPFCREEVDPNFLLDFSGGRSRMRIREQADFCRTHKRMSATKDYQSKGYPTVEWESIETRFPKYDKHLQSVLENTTPSHFREQLEKKADSGKDRTLFQAHGSGSLQGLTPGYYGTRGARLMDQYIIRKYGSKLRRLAPTDKVIAARDASGFVQAVLVPELAMKMIMDDMDVDEEQARSIMTESIALGDLVNEEVDDVLQQTQALSQRITVEDGSDDERF